MDVITNRHIWSEDDEEDLTMADNGGMLKGAIIGGFVGAVAALLLAPKAGRELREDIKDRYIDVQDRTKQIITDVGTKTQEVVKQVGEQASEVVDKTRSAVSAAKDEVASWKDEKIAEIASKDSKVN
jgi:gas vesicle protein